MSYNYAPEYATEDQELSESDCPSDHVMQHVTSGFKELYRRKHQAMNHNPNFPGTYYHTHMPGYYEQHSRLPTSCGCNFAPDPRFCCYKAVPQPQDVPFRSSTQICPNLKTCPDAKTVSTTTKKYPVTARTPRYIRGPPGQLCKRPSALCLPVTCQPDPAVSHRPRKASTEIQHYRGQEASYAINDYVMRTTAVKRTDTRPVDSEGDVNLKLNDLENLLTKFDDRDLEDEEGETEHMEITGVKDLSKILKPRVPATVKAKQDKVLKLRAVQTNLTETAVTTEKINKLEVEEASEPLEVLLKNLQQEAQKTEEKPPNRFCLKPQVSSKMRNSTEQKPPLDDTSALELHKSKSYIVSLIDKALSKELGTIPGDKCTRSEFLNMNPSKAVNLVNRHSNSATHRGITDVEVAQGSCSKEDSCICKNEEPMYLRQLKQLRWSHLRHIQREAKRLADLEKFLDSFSEGDSPS